MKTTKTTKTLALPLLLVLMHSEITFINSFIVFTYFALFSRQITNQLLEGDGLTQEHNRTADVCKNSVEINLHLHDSVHTCIGMSCDCLITMLPSVCPWDLGINE